MTKPLVTVVGVGPGVGLAVARRFGRGGYRVALVARRGEVLEEYVGELGRDSVEASGFVGDAGNEGSLRSAFASIREGMGATDVLVYNAAVLKQCQPSEIVAEDLVYDFRVNVVGALVSAQEVIPDMRRAHRGTILFTGGGFALSPMAAFASLAIGKAAIRNLTQSLAMELEPSGIHVATVTICGLVKPGSHFDPDKIAEAYWTLHAQEAGKFEREMMYR